MCLTKYTTKKINSKIVFGDVPDVSAETLDVRRKYSTKIYIDIEHNINMFQTTEQTMLNKHPHAHTVCKQTNVLSKETKRTGLDRMLYVEQIFTGKLLLLRERHEFWLSFTSQTNCAWVNGMIKNNRMLYIHFSIHFYHYFHIKSILSL